MGAPADDPRRRPLGAVTGGSRGIGRAICLALDTEGARVVVHYHQNRGAADEVCGKLKNAPALAHADLASLASIEKMFEALGDVRLDILVNNAGVWKSTPLRSTSKELLDEIVDVNLKGMFWVWCMMTASLPSPLFEVEAHRSTKPVLAVIGDTMRRRE